jgi:AhpD family alkylhydroperoxidase
MSRMFIRTARRSSLAQIRHVRPVRPDDRGVPGGSAPDLVARVYAEVEREFGMLAPPMALHAPAPEVLAAGWLMLRETLLAGGLVDRETKEAVGTAVSQANACPYCVEVHGATLRGLATASGAGGLDGAGGYGRGDAAAITDGHAASIADPAVREIYAWARASGRRDAAVRHGRPFPVEQTPELVGVALTFQYLNRMVNLFLRESPFPPGLPPVARGGLLRLLMRILRPTTRMAREPGAALGLLPAAPLPEDLSWAAGNPSVADAFARAAAAIDAAGERAAPAPVRDLVAATLAEWSGQAQGLSRAWADEAVSGLPAGDRPAARLALLTALASYQVDRSVIDDFRRDHPGDEALIGLTSWASMAAARRVGEWLGAARPPRSSTVSVPQRTPRTTAEDYI